ncbi:hypothetical protein [Amycolatopsis pithecellobii]|uniref:DUF2029 domain-containing protein n=1 Tax=Amycolatopsis pithecellobii TaxID=664692 RepID=A0A6N7YXI3_9PSEU|nr:hypothetical protein [Amycolatopsis pithecellobii]MTD57797.1 hypothetical protein [Amycolatopsis pithecellobii]
MSTAVAADTGTPKGSGIRTGVVVAVVSAVGVAAACVFLLVRNSIVDDAYITLSYAKNLAFHLHWGLTPGHTANTATSPLNVLTQGLLTAILRRPIVALGALFVLSHMAMAYGLVRTSSRLRLPVWSALLGSALVLFNPLLNSAVGLEIALSGGLLALLLMAAVEARPVWFGILAGLVVLTRIDLAIVVLVLFLGFPRLRLAWWRIVVSALAVALPWWICSWILLGSAVPDTLLIKATLSAQQPQLAFAEGPLNMYRGFPAMAALSFLPAMLGFVALLVCLARWVRNRFGSGENRAWPGFAPVVLLGIGGVLHYAMYSLLNAPLFHWYYSWTIISLTYLLALSLGALAAKTQQPVRFRAWAVPGVVVALVAAAQVGYDVQHGIPWQQGAYNGNAGTPAEYAAVGIGIKPLVGNHPVRSPGEVGTIAYFCECELLDELSDRGIAVSILRRQEQTRGPIVRALLDLNFHFLDKNLEPTPVDYEIAYRKTRPENVPNWPVTGPAWIGNGYDALVPAR